MKVNIERAKKCLEIRFNYDDDTTNGILAVPSRDEIALIRDACNEFLEQEKPRSYETSCMFCRHIAETSEKEPCNGCFKGDRFEAKEKYESLKELKKKRITQVVYNDVVQAIMNNAQREILDEVLNLDKVVMNDKAWIRIVDIEKLRESLK